MEAKVEAIEFKNIQDKITWWIKITREGKSALINVGKKTYESVKKLDEPIVDENQIKLPLDGEQPQPEKQPEEGTRGSIQQLEKDAEVRNDIEIRGQGNGGAANKRGSNK